MPAFTGVTGRMAPLLVENIDTDQIIPARYLKVTERSGLGSGLFADWRYRAGAPDPDFVLNQAPFQGARILLAGANFGSGSSREHAVWALLESGIGAVVSTRIADIFRSNALRNGLLAVTVSAPDFADLVRRSAADPGATWSVDLAAQAIRWHPAGEIPFAIDPFARHRLLHGIDELQFLLDQLDRIELHEAAHPPRVDTRLQAARTHADGT